MTNVFHVVLATVVTLFVTATAPAQAADPLPSWNDGPTREAIETFVAKVTDKDGPDYVPPADRIAVFDNDGTLWAEKPAYFQLLFAVDRVKELAPENPDWKDKEPYKSAIAGDLAGLAKSGKKGLAEIVAASHAGVSAAEFQNIVKRWLKGARHPETGRKYTEMVYQPMLELLTYLRDNGFTTYIVSGGGIEFIRAFAEDAYGIPPAQVVGSAIKTKYETVDGAPQLTKMPEVAFIDDGPGKPVGINAFIGERPIAAFGNSDGDFEMLEWTTAGDGPRLGAIVHHTDGTREYAYDRESHVGRLDKGLDQASDRGWILIDMKEDWKEVYPPAE